MPINPAIALGVQPLQLADPLAQYARVAAIQQAQNQNALAQYQLGAAQREEATQNALSRAYQEAYNPETGAYDINKLRGSLISAGVGAKLPGIEKQMGELRTQQLAQSKTETELLDAKLKQSRQFLEGIDPMDPAAPQQYIQWHEANHRDPLLGPLLASRGVTADQSRARIMQAIQQGPQALSNLINQSKLGTEKFMELNKPITTPQDLSGTVRMLQTPGLGGAATVVPGSEAAKTMAPGEEERLRISRAQLRVAQDAEARQAQEAAQRDNVVASTITDAAGNARFFNRLGQEITPTGAGGAAVPVRGKPSATYEKTEAQRAQMAKDLDTAIFELKDAVKEGGLIDQSTGSGAGRAVDVAAGFIGQATPGAIAIAKLKPVADLALKMVPRFEGPQSDKDTQSYKEAAGQLADPTLPNKIRKEAANTIIRLMQNRKGQFVSPEMAGEGVAPSGSNIDALLNKYK